MQGNLTQQNDGVSIAKRRHTSMCALITHSLDNDLLIQRRQRGETGQPQPLLLLQRLLAWENVNGRSVLALAVEEQRDPVAVLMLLQAWRATIELSQQQLLEEDVHAALRWAALEQPPGWREILIAGVRRRRQPKTNHVLPVPSMDPDGICPCASVCGGSQGQQDQGDRYGEYREEGSGYGEDVEAEACFGATEAGHALSTLSLPKEAPPPWSTSLTSARACPWPFHRPFRRPLRQPLRRGMRRWWERRRLLLQWQRDFNASCSKLLSLLVVGTVEATTARRLRRREIGASSQY